MGVDSASDIMRVAAKGNTYPQLGSSLMTVQA